jgi:hypothetical protein
VPYCKNIEVSVYVGNFLVVGINWRRRRKEDEQN